MACMGPSNMFDSWTWAGCGLEGRPDLRDVLYGQGHPHLRRRRGVPKTDLHRYVCSLVVMCRSHIACAVLVCLLLYNAVFRLIPASVRLAGLLDPGFLSESSIPCFNSLLSRDSESARQYTTMRWLRSVSIVHTMVGVMHVLQGHINDSSPWLCRMLSAWVAL